MLRGPGASWPQHYKFVQKVNSFLLNIYSASASKFIGANKLGYKIYQSLKLNFSYY